MGFSLALSPEGAFAVSLPGIREVRWGVEAEAGSLVGEGELGVGVAWVDLDGDGLREVVAAQAGAGCRVVWTPADEARSSHPPDARCWWDDQPYAEAIGLHGADLDGDGRQEVLVGLPSRGGMAGEVVALTGAPLGRAAWEDALGRWTGDPGSRLGQSLATVDLDRSGAAELAVGVDVAERTRVVLALDPLGAPSLLRAGWWLPLPEGASVGAALVGWEAEGRSALAAAGHQGAIFVWSTP
jgi:hypothetical protein